MQELVPLTVVCASTSLIISISPVPSVGLTDAQAEKATIWRCKACAPKSDSHAVAAAKKIPQTAIATESADTVNADVQVSQQAVESTLALAEAPSSTHLSEQDDTKADEHNEGSVPDFENPERELASPSKLDI